jgi:WD repeat-containing protein 23
MGEGQFGTDQHYVDRLKKRKMGFATDLMWRELGIDAYGVRRRADQAISQVSRLPNGIWTTPDHNTQSRK